MKAKFDTHVHSTMRVSVEESVATFEKIFKWTSVEKALFLGLPQDSKDNCDYTQNVKTLFYKKYFNGYAFFGLYDGGLSGNALSEHLLKQAETAYRAGFDGVKMLDGKPNMRKAHGRFLSDSVYDNFFAFMEKTGFPITLHNSDPITHWDLSKMSTYAIEHGWYCGDGPSKQELFDDVIKVMDKFPNLHLTLAHFGFTCDDVNDAEKFLSYPHTMLDTTPGGDQFFNMLSDWSTWHAFLVKHQDRIKYGTDSYNFDAKDDNALWLVSTKRPFLQADFFETDGEHYYYEDKFTGVKLEEKILDKIYMQNALREYGEPRKINVTYANESIASLLKIYADDEFRKHDLLYLKEKF